VLRNNWKSHATPVRRFEGMVVSALAAFNEELTARVQKGEHDDITGLLPDVKGGFSEGVALAVDGSTVFIGTSSGLYRGWVADFVSPPASREQVYPGRLWWITSAA